MSEHADPTSMHTHTPKSQTNLDSGSTSRDHDVVHAVVVKSFAERGRGLAAVAFVLGADLEAVDVGADLHILHNKPTRVRH